MLYGIFSEKELADATFFIPMQLAYASYGSVVCLDMKFIMKEEYG